MEKLGEYDDCWICCCGCTEKLGEYDDCWICCCSSCTNACRCVEIVEEYDDAGIVKLVSSVMA